MKYTKFKRTQHQIPIKSQLPIFKGIKWNYWINSTNKKSDGKKHQCKIVFTPLPSELKNIIIYIYIRYSTKLSWTVKHKEKSTTEKISWFENFIWAYMPSYFIKYCYCFLLVRIIRFCYSILSLFNNQQVHKYFKKWKYSIKCIDIFVNLFKFPLPSQNTLRASSYFC